MQNGKSTDYFPRKYENVVYSLEFSSLKNTSLSTVNPRTYCNTPTNIAVRPTKNKLPETEKRSDLVPGLSPTP